MALEYRQKILNWLTTIGMVLLLTALLFANQWFKVTTYQANHGFSNFSIVAGSMGESLFFYILLAPICLFWHLFDFVEKSVPFSATVRRLTSYASFLSAIVIVNALLSLMALGVWRYNSCDEMKGAFFFQCIERPSLWLMIPWLAAMAVALFLCLSKAIFATRSLLAKT